MWRKSPTNPPSGREDHPFQVPSSDVPAGPSTAAAAAAYTGAAHRSPSPAAYACAARRSPSSAAYGDPYAYNGDDPYQDETYQQSSYEQGSSYQPLQQHCQRGSRKQQQQQQQHRRQHLQQQQPPQFEEPAWLSRQVKACAPAPNELSLVGRPCLIHEDDDVAADVAGGGGLLPWKGEDSLMIDRFDVRHLLDDLKTIRRKKGGRGGGRGGGDAGEGGEEEEMERERYVELEMIEKEERRKAAAAERKAEAEKGEQGIGGTEDVWEKAARSRGGGFAMAAAASEYVGGHGQAPVEQQETHPSPLQTAASSGGDAQTAASASASAATATGEAAAEGKASGFVPPFEMPSELQQCLVCSTLTLEFGVLACSNSSNRGSSSSSREWQSEWFYAPCAVPPELRQCLAGAQAEIVLRVKQKANPAFAFLFPDNSLHPFFRFLVANPQLVGEGGKGKGKGQGEGKGEEGEGGAKGGKEGVGVGEGQGRVGGERGGRVSVERGSAVMLLGAAYGEDEEEEDGKERTKEEEGKEGERGEKGNEEDEQERLVATEKGDVEKNDEGREGGSSREGRERQQGEPTEEDGASEERVTRERVIEGVEGSRWFTESEPAEAADEVAEEAGVEGLTEISSQGDALPKQPCPEQPPPEQPPPVEPPLVSDEPPPPGMETGEEAGRADRGGGEGEGGEEGEEGDERAEGGAAAGAAGGAGGAGREGGGRVAAGTVGGEEAEEVPESVRGVVGKMVEFIVRNGNEFESIVRQRDAGEGRFPFLLPGDRYHRYYQRTLQEALEVVGKMVEFIVRKGHEFGSIVRQRDAGEGRFPFLLPGDRFHAYYQRTLKEALEVRVGVREGVRGIEAPESVVRPLPAAGRPLPCVLPVHTAGGSAAPDLVLPLPAAGRLLLPQLPPAHSKGRSGGESGRQVSAGGGEGAGTGALPLPAANRVLLCPYQRTLQAALQVRVGSRSNKGNRLEGVLFLSTASTFFLLPPSTALPVAKQASCLALLFLLCCLSQFPLRPFTSALPSDFSRSPSLLLPPFLSLHTSLHTTACQCSSGVDATAAPSPSPLHCRAARETAVRT
ncbi:unnamed protein product [Closterium sp. NIES-54]